MGLQEQLMCEAIDLYSQAKAYQTFAEAKLSAARCAIEHAEGAVAKTEKEMIAAAVKAVQIGKGKSQVVVRNNQGYEFKKDNSGAVSLTEVFDVVLF